MFYVKIPLLAALIAQCAEASTPTMGSKNYSSQSEYLKDVSEDIQSDAVKTLLEIVDRKNYVEDNPYNGGNIQIGYGATFSKLDMQAFALDKLSEHLKEGSRALDVGSGTGYLTTCMALMVGRTGHVVGVEHVPQLVNKAKEYVTRDKPFLLEEGRLEFREGDGRLGAADQGPFDAIHIGAKILDIGEIPEALMEQLKPSGRMIVLVNVPMSYSQNYQTMAIVDKFPNGSVFKNIYKGYFVLEPCELLTDKQDQLGIIEYTTHHHY